MNVKAVFTFITMVCYAVVLAVLLVMSYTNLSLNLRILESLNNEASAKPSPHCGPVATSN